MVKSDLLPYIVIGPICVLVYIAGNRKEERGKEMRNNARFIAISYIIGLWAALPFCAMAAEPAPANHAVVFLYHRFGDGAYPATNIALEQFDRHLAELQSGPYSVLPLDKIITHIRAKQALPDRTVGISIDDAHLSFYKNAWPKLRAARLPFAIFVATESVEQNNPDYMSWDQLREIAQSGLAIIGSQTHSHPHMAHQSRQKNAQEILASQQLFEKRLGFKPAIFAYPYGEYNLDTQKLMAEMGFAASFAQHSGVIHGGSDFFALPRFAMNESYGQIERFVMAANALPLPVYDLAPLDPVLTQNPPAIGFNIDPAIGGKGLSCFASDQGAVKADMISGTRVEIRLNAPWPQGRARLNCTMPGPDGRYRWFGMQYLADKTPAF